jgi:hypothetical protein
MRQIFVFLLSPAPGLAAAQPGYGGRAPAGGPPTISIGQVVDGREDRSNRSGTIRSHMGIPIRSVDSDQPVPAVVAGTFAQALQARGLLAPPGAGRYRLDIVIRRLDADKLKRSEAHADFGAVLVDQRTGAPVYQDEAVADTMTGSVMSLDAGIFANAGDMKQQVARTAAQAVEGVLSKPGFAAALRR